MERIKNAWQTITWGTGRIPDLSGRVFIVTGSNRRAAPDHRLALLYTAGGTEVSNSLSLYLSLYLFDFRIKKHAFIEQAL
jgi:hypothetical protein